MENDKRFVARHYFAEKDEKVAQQQELTTLEEQLKELQRTHKGYLEAIRANELKCSRVEFEINNFNEQLEENYQLTYEEAEELALQLKMKSICDVE